jgi:hypothetical protein
MSLPRGASAARCIGLPVILARGGMDAWPDRSAGLENAYPRGCLAGALASRRVGTSGPATKTRP